MWSNKIGASTPAGEASPAAVSAAVNPVAWLPCRRLIASRFPTVGLSDQVAAPEELHVVLAIGALTNPLCARRRGN